MRTIKALLLATILAACAWGQQTSLNTGNINTSGSDCSTATSCVYALFQPLTQGSASIWLTGTWSGTVQFEVSSDIVPNNPTNAQLNALNWVSVSAFPVASTTGTTNTTANGLWTFNAANITALRMRASALASGVVAVTMRSSTASARSNGGGGGGSGTPNIYTVATLPAGLGVGGTGTIAAVKDGSTASDCTVGGGGNAVACIWTGSAWAFAGSSASAPAYSAITSATNTTATMTCGTGCTQTFSGTGVVNADQVNGAAVPTSAALAATNASKQITSVSTIPTSTVPAFTGDMTNSAGSLATTVASLNGGSIPASAKVLGTNVSSQPIAAALTSGHLLIGSAGNLPVDTAISGDSSLVAAGTMTNTGINGAAVPASAFVAGTNSSSQVVATACSSANLMVGSSGNVPACVALTGDSSITNAGVMTNTKLNGGTVPTSASVLGTNGSAQPIADTAHQIQTPQVCGGSGTGTAQTCSTSVTFVAASGDCINFSASTNNTGDVTISVNGGSAFHVYKWANSSTLASGDMVAGVTEVTCLDTNNHWQWPTVGNAPASGATINNQLQYGAPYYSTPGSNNTLSGVAPPATQGYFGYEWLNPTAAATVPQAVQIGLGGRAITGATTTDTVLFSDVDNVVDHDQAASGAVTETLPTPSTLSNTTFAFRYTNHSAQTDTVTPSGGLTIQVGTTAAASTLSVPSGQACLIKVDPNAPTTNWLADCGPNTGTAGTGTVTSSGSPVNHQIPVFTTATNIKGLTLPVGNLIDGQFTGDPIVQTKPAFDVRDTPGALGSPTLCDQMNNAAAGNPADWIDIRGLSSQTLPCNDVNMDNPFSDFLANGMIITTDQGFNFGNRQVIRGIVANITATATNSGLQFKGTNNFPLGNSAGALTCSGTATQTHLSCSKAAGSNIMLAPYDILTVAGDNTIYYVKNCVTGASNCAFTTNSFPLLISSVNNASAGSTVYNGTFTGCAANACTGTWIINGFNNVGNNGTFTATATTATTITVTSSAGIAETHTASGVEETADNSNFYQLNGGGTITIQITPALASSPVSAATQLTSAVIAFDDWNSSSPSGEQLEDAWITCGVANTTAGNAGNAIGLRDVLAQENSHARNVWIQNCAYGFWIPSAANSGDWSNLNVGYTNNISGIPGATGLVVPFEISGAHKKVSRVTITTQTLTAAKVSKGIFHVTNAQLGSISSPGGIVLDQIHGEANGTFSGTCPNTVDMVLIDSANPSPAGGITGPVEVAGASGAPSANCVKNLVHVASNFFGTLNYHDSECNSGTTNAIQDDINSNTMICATGNNANGLGYYRIDSEGTAWTNFECADMTKGWCESHGLMTYYSGGVAQVKLTGTTGHVQGVALDCGITGTTSCVITGSGSASGTATLTWPATAGTTTNAIVSSNNIQATGFVGGTGSVTTLAASGQATFSANGAASTPGVLISGTPFTGGSGTTTQPQLYLQSTGSAPTAFSTAGTGIGFNAPSGYTGSIFDSFVNGGTNNRFTVSYGGGATNFLNLNSASGFTGNFLNFTVNGGSQVFGVNNQGNVTITQTAASQFALNLTNSTAATSSTAQSSPFDIRTGQFWLNYFPSSTGFIAASSQADCWAHQVVETNGTNGSSVYQLLHNSSVDNCQGSPSSSYLQTPFEFNWGVQTNALAQPATPVITTHGTAGAATWTYTVVACIGPTCTQPSANGTLSAAGNATLTTSNYNIITWSATTNADYYKVYRTLSGGTPSSLGIIAVIPSGSTASGASCSASTCVVNDEALVGDTTTAQAYNSTGQVFVGTAPSVGGGSGGGMFATQGTIPTVGASTASGWYANSTDGNVHIVNGVTSGTTPNDWGYLTGVVGKAIAQTDTTSSTILSVTPPALAGTYRGTMTITTTGSASSCVLGWTATWHDINGSAKAPTNLSLLSDGTASPALTFTVSAATTFHGEVIMDIDNSGTAMVLKSTIGTGTCTGTKASAILEKLN